MRLNTSPSLSTNTRKSDTIGVVLVISPHLDDAVFSAGQLLAGHPGSVVVTVFAGVPAPQTTDPYDQGCGFADSEQAMRHRRREDETALGMLGASPVHLDLFGIQYGEHSDDEMASAIDEVIARLKPDRVAGPVGMAHPDHIRVGVVWRRVLDGYPQIEKFAFEDLPYRLTFPRKSREAISALVKQYGAEEARLPAGDIGAKACAMLAYTSQLRAATPLKCLEPERLWHLADRLEDT
jgi:LmbE family N-acetylglucosaminyl deacetylase